MTTKVIDIIWGDDISYVITSDNESIPVDTNLLDELCVQNTVIGQEVIVSEVEKIAWRDTIWVNIAGGQHFESKIDRSKPLGKSKAVGFLRTNGDIWDVLAVY